jgi:hypothetical protein
MRGWEQRKENGGWPMTDVRSSRRYLSQGTLTTRPLHTRHVRACEIVTAVENATAVFNLAPMLSASSSSAGTKAGVLPTMNSPQSSEGEGDLCAWLTQHAGISRNESGQPA